MGAVGVSFFVSIAGVSSFLVPKENMGAAGVSFFTSVVSFFAPKENMGAAGASFLASAVGVSSFLVPKENMGAVGVSFFTSVVGVSSFFAPNENVGTAEVSFFVPNENTGGEEVSFFASDDVSSFFTPKENLEAGAVSSFIFIVGVSPFFVFPVNEESSIEGCFESASGLSFFSSKEILRTEEGSFAELTEKEDIFEGPGFSTFFSFFSSLRIIENTLLLPPRFNSSFNRLTGPSRCTPTEPSRTLTGD